MIALRAALQRAADAHSRGEAPRGWLIVCSGAGAGREQGQGQRQGQRQGRERQRRRAPSPAVRAHGEPALTPLHRTARDFLREHGIRFQTRHNASPPSLKVEARNLDAAVALYSKARLRHWIMRTGLARFTMATSLVALYWLGPQIFMLGNLPGVS